MHNHLIIWVYCCRYTANKIVIWQWHSSSSLSSYPTFMWGRCIRWHTPPCSTVVHFISRQSLLFDIILYIVQPYSLRHSSPPSPLYFNFHRPPSYVVFLSYHHMPIPLQPTFLDFLCDFPHFRCPSYYFISYLVQSCNSAHPSFSFLRPPIYVNVPSSTPMYLPRTPVPVIPLSCTPSASIDLHVHSPVRQHSIHSLLVLPPTLHSVGDFRVQFSILRQRRYHVCECLHSLYCLSLWMDICVLMFTAPQLFSLIYTNLLSSLFHCASPFLKLPFDMLSYSTAHHYIVCKQHPPRGLLFDVPSHHIQYHVKQLGAQWGSLMQSHANRDLARHSYTGINLCSWIPMCVSMAVTVVCLL